MKKRSLLALAMVGALSVSMLAGCGSSSTKKAREFSCFFVKLLDIHILSACFCAH